MQAIGDGDVASTIADHILATCCANSPVSMCVADCGVLRPHEFRSQQVSSGLLLADCAAARQARPPMSNIRTTFNDLAARGGGTTAPAGSECPPRLRSVLQDLEFLLPGETPPTTPIAASATTEVTAADLAWGRVVIKRALAAETEDSAGPAERAATEAAWLRLMKEIAPGAVPELLGEHRGSPTLVLEWLDPGRAPQWSEQLASGNAEPTAAAAVGHLYGRMHAATAGRPAFAERFAAERAFRQLAVEPRFAVAAVAHPDCGDALRAASDAALRLRVALVHGAALPENILLGPRGPVLVDGDCARYGDPAFDVATLVASLMLHAVRPGTGRNARPALDALLATYVQHVTWEIPTLLVARVAALVPALLLAGIDGRAPVPFIVNRNDANRVRRAARVLLVGPAPDLETTRAVWFREFQG
ncbi:MAG: putative aminoglycoside phosphotransferase [Proteobacteria bacterium]|nr:putative aminoglycoside phosphotransferase [Pseudomonadota bacterium]